MNAVGNGEGKSWLAWLATAMAEVKLTEAHDIGGEASPKDKVIGTLPEDLVRMRAVSADLSKQLEVLYNEHIKKHGERHRHGAPECDAFHAKADWLQRQAKLISDVFWVSAIHQFNAQDKNLAIRKGNVLVEIPDEERDKSPILEVGIISIPMPRDLAAVLAGLGERPHDS